MIHRKIISSNGTSIQLVRTNHQDDLSLGYNLFKEHGLSLSTDINNYFKFSIVQHCSPNLLDVIQSTSGYTSKETFFSSKEKFYLSSAIKIYSKVNSTPNNCELLK